MLTFEEHLDRMGFLPIPKTLTLDLSIRIILYLDMLLGLDLWDRQLSIYSFLLVLPKPMPYNSMVLKE